MHCRSFSVVLHVICRFFSTLRISASLLLAFSISLQVIVCQRTTLIFSQFFHAFSNTPKLLSRARVQCICVVALKVRMGVPERGNFTIWVPTCCRPHLDLIISYCSNMNVFVLLRYADVQIFPSWDVWIFHYENFHLS